MHPTFIKKIAILCAYALLLLSVTFLPLQASALTNSNPLDESTFAPIAQGITLGITNFFSQTAPVSNSKVSEGFSVQTRTPLVRSLSANTQSTGVQTRFQKYLQSTVCFVKDSVSFLDDCQNEITPVEVEKIILPVSEIKITQTQTEFKSTPNTNSQTTLVSNTQTSSSQNQITQNPTTSSIQGSPALAPLFFSFIDLRLAQLKQEILNEVQAPSVVYRTNNSGGGVSANTLSRQTDKIIDSIHDSIKNISSLDNVTSLTNSGETNLNGNTNLAGAINFTGTLTLTGSAGTVGQVLTSNGAGSTPVWSTPAAGVTQLSDLSDVSSATQTNRNILISNGATFASRALVEADISDLQAYLTASNGLQRANNLSDILDITSARTNLGLGSLATLSDLSTFDTGDLTEGSNLYYSDTRARSAFSNTTTGLTYTSGTGVLELTSGYEIPTTASTTDWDTAFGWGNHASVGYLTAESDTLATVTARGATTATQSTFTGGLLSGLGTALLPSYSFTGDTNTGMWSPTADTLAFSTGGSERMRLNSNGRLGIGAATAYANLDVGGLITSPGLTSPVALFSGNIAGASGIEMQNTNSGTSSEFRFRINADTGSSYMAFTMPSTGNTSTLFGATRSTLGALFTVGRDLGIGTFSPGTDIILGTANAESMRIRASGNVGIGTGSTVSARIHAISTTEQFRSGYDTSNYWNATTNSTGLTTFGVAGSSTGFSFTGGNVGINSTPQNGVTLRVSGTVGVTGTLYASNITNYGWFNSDISIIPGSAKDIIFKEGTNEIVRFVGLTGNVGIGVTAPGAKLQIDTGVATTKGLIVKGFTSQTANLQEWQDSTGTALTYINSDGQIRMGSPSGSSNQFLIDVERTGQARVRTASGARSVEFSSFSADHNYLRALGSQFRIGTYDSNTMYFVTNSAIQGGINSSGLWSVGSTSFTAKLGITSTTEQLRSGYDASNYWNATTDSVGLTTFDAVGSGAGFGFSDALYGSLGTVALPSYSFTGDTNTGMWSPTADTLAWSTGGSERVRLNSTGLGVFTSSPTNAISLGGDSARTIWMERTTGTNGNDLTIEAGGAAVGGTDRRGGSLYIKGGISTGNGGNSSSGGNIFFQTSRTSVSGTSDTAFTTRMTINARGALGYGSGSLGGYANAGLNGFDISYGGSPATLVLGAENGAETRTNNTDKTFRIGGAPYSSSHAPVAILVGSATNTANVLYWGGGTGVMNTATMQSFYAAANNTTGTGTEIARLTTNGIRIEPAGVSGGASTALHLVSTTEQFRVGYNTSNYWSNTISATGGLTMQGVGTGGSLTLSPTAGQNINLSLSGTGDFTVNTNDLSVDTSAGFVGIGTITPSQKLEVNGNIRTTSGYLNLTGSGSNTFLGNGSLITGGAATDTALRANTGALLFSDNGNQEKMRLTSGNLGIGTGSTVSARIHAISTTEQLRSGYDTSNYWNVTTGSTGQTTFAGAGTSPSFKFTRNVVFEPDASNGVTINTSSSNNSKLTWLSTSVITGMTNFGSTNQAATVGVANNDGGMVFSGYTDNGSGTYTPALNFKGYIAEGNTTNAAVQFSSLRAAGTGAGGINTSDLSFQFINSSTALMSILGGGNVGIGTTTPSVKLTVVGNGQFTAVGSGAYAFDLNLTSDGTLTTSASDQRLKKNITTLNASSTLDKLLQLNPTTFDWKSNGAHDIGLIAQEVEQIFPELVFTNPTDGYKGVNYSRLPTIIVASVQEIVRIITEFANLIQTKLLKADKIETQKLCIDGVCITKEQLQMMLNSSGTSGTHSTPTTTSSSGGSGSNSSSGTSNATSTNSEDSSSNTEGENDTATSTPDVESNSEPVVDTEPEPEPEPVVDTEPEPEPETETEPTPAPEPAPAPAPVSTPEPASAPVQ